MVPVKIVCISDTHGALPVIPECDVLIHCGDICPDMHRSAAFDHDLMRMQQMEWLREEYYEWEQTVPAKEIFATLGNHDWISTFPKACRSQMFIDGLVHHEGKMFWFTPWVPHCGDWNYQLSRDQRAIRFADIPYKLDLLVSHAPPFGVGDQVYGNPGEPVGCRELRREIQQKQPRYGVFGHIHEGQRFGREFRLGGTKLFNCAMFGADWKPVVIDLK